MPTWLLIVVLVAIVAIVLIALIVIDAFVARRRRHGEDLSADRTSVDFTEASWSADQRVYHLFLPGILSRGREQINPILPSLEGRGNVRVADYHGYGGDFDPEAISKDMYKWIRPILEGHPGSTVVIHGISIGGIVAAFVARDLLEMGVDPGRVRFVFYDTPTGMDDLPIPKVLKRLFGAVNPGPVFSATIGALMLRLGRRLPRDENIVYPGASEVWLITRLMGRMGDEAEFRDWVKETAKEGLSGHSFDRWWQQLAAIKRVGETGLPYDSVNRFRAVYLACLPQADGLSNETVTQPQAVEAWVSEVPGLIRMDIDSLHCGFLETPLVWGTTLAYELMEQLDLSW